MDKRNTLKSGLRAPKKCREKADILQASLGRRCNNREPSQSVLTGPAYTQGSRIVALLMRPFQTPQPMG